MSDEMVPVGRQVAGALMDVDRVPLDLEFITRNIRDLSKTAQFSHMTELEELYNMAYVNLKKQLVEGKPLAEDPQLALEAFRTLSSVVVQVVEVKRKAADTLLKAKNLVDVPAWDRGAPLVSEDDEDGEDFLGVSVDGEASTGIFGKASAVDPETGQDAGEE